MTNRDDQCGRGKGLLVLSNALSDQCVVCCRWLVIYNIQAVTCCGNKTVTILFSNMLTC
jgi:hypothetical protein